jgi:hypothetical protein
MIKFRSLVFAALIGATATFSACAGFQGRLTTPTTEAPAIQDLLADHKNYDVYFAGRAVHLPTALAFDPKGDDMKLVFHEYWMPVTDPRLTKEIIEWMALDHHYRPWLYQITGSNGNFYGYLYSNETKLAITSPEPGVLRVGNVHPTHWDFILNEF